MPRRRDFKLAACKTLASRQNIYASDLDPRSTRPHGGTATADQLWRDRERESDGRGPRQSLTRQIIIFFGEVTRTTPRCSGTC